MNPFISTSLIKIQLSSTIRVKKKGIFIFQINENADCITICIGEGHCIIWYIE